MPLERAITRTSLFYQGVEKFLNKSYMLLTEELKKPGINFRSEGFLGLRHCEKNRFTFVIIIIIMIILLLFSFNPGQVRNFRFFVICFTFASRKF